MTKTELLNHHRQIVKALKQNKRKAIGQMRDKYYGRCCLRVAEDYCMVHSEEKVQRGSKGLPHKSMRKWLGCDHSYRLKVGTGKSAINVSADGLNDEYGVPHAVIAEFWANTFVHPTKPRLTPRARKIANKIIKYIKGEQLSLNKNII